MTSNLRSASGLTIPPPIIYLGALVIAYALSYLSPLSLSLEGWGRIIGALCIILSIPIMPPVLARFKKVDTPFDVRNGAKVLITDGPFRFSRNPTYVSLTLLYLGLGFVFDNVWVLILALPVLILMDQWIIKREEFHLEAVFGEKYLHYKSNVRRWL